MQAEQIRDRQDYYAGISAAEPGPASLGDRFLGQFIDGLIGAVGLMVMTGTSYLLGTLGGVGETLMVLGFFGGVFLLVMYYLFADGLPGGQSLGKRVARTMTVDRRTGRPCSYGQSFLRNLSLWILGPIDWIFILGSNRQRLGDKLADTIVIEAR